MDRIAFMKKILLLLGTCIALANARQYTIESLKNPRISQQALPQLNQVQKSIDLSRDTLSEEQWLEVEKNEIVKICIDGQIPVWETSLNAAIVNDSCLAIQAPLLIGVDTLKAYFSQNDEPHNINLAVGMKYLNFKNEDILLGYNEYTEEELREYSFLSNVDPERHVFVTGTYLVDKYPMTNCEFLQTMWDSIPEKTSYKQTSVMQISHSEWLSRKRAGVRNENCPAHDSATCNITTYQAMNYANLRSIRDGLKPYYIFSETEEQKTKIWIFGSYVIDYDNFTENGKDYIQVNVDFSSDGYRLPYYDEWMMFARGGDKKKAPWGDTTATFEEVSKYAKYKGYFRNDKRPFQTEPVGQLLPNGYGLYDMFGLAEERVLLKELIEYNPSNPTCLKGGGYKDSAEWKYYNYGYFTVGSQMYSGFRLIRNIGNNAKWKESKTNDKQ